MVPGALGLGSLGRGIWHPKGKTAIIGETLKLRFLVYARFLAVERNRRVVAIH